MNECFLESHNCDEHARCTNSIGSFECACNEGFAGNGTTCEDMDECSTTGIFQTEKQENNIFQMRNVPSLQTVLIQLVDLNVGTAENSIIF